MPQISHPKQISASDPPALRAVPSTLMIPLAARAHGQRWFPSLDCHDNLAMPTLQCLTANVNAYLADQPTVLNILWRTRRICEAGNAFFEQHPDAWGINIGCGLSHYFQWLDHGHNHWVDADLPEVINLRRTLPGLRSDQLHSARIDLRQPNWWEALQLPDSARAQPLFIVCEGVLMYLEPEQVHQTLAQIVEHAPPGSRLLVDTLAQCAVGMAGLHASVGHTGAQFRWGIRHLEELTASHPRLRLAQCHSVTECYGWLGASLDWFWRPWISAPLYGLAELEVLPA